MIYLLNGRWEISRQIINNENNRFSAIAKGVAIFYKQFDESSLLHENVTVNWTNGSTSLATKSYLFSQTEEALLQYRFAQPINLLKKKQLPQAVISKKILMHRFILKPIFNFETWYNSLYCCGMDQYKLSFKIVSTDSFLMNYQIYGSNKNCYINTIYTKTK